MAKKIYDVLPPAVAVKMREVKKDFSSKKKKIRVRNISGSGHKKVEHKKKVRRFPLREILVGVLIIVFLLGIYLYNKLPKAEIQVWPKLENLTLSAKITADQSVVDVYLIEDSIPARQLEVIEDDSQLFNATGSSSSDTKASGTITVYNKVSPSTPLTLIKGTHFLSDSGKYFVTLGKIVVPGSSGKTPGSIEVKVEAKESGPDYNIGTSNFSVPKLSGTVYYYNIWAESKNKMSGGQTGVLKKVTKEDLKLASDSLTQKLMEQAEDSLRSQITPDDILFDSAISREVISSSADSKVDAVVEKFSQSAKVKVKALVFKRSDIEKFSKGYILSKIEDHQSFLDESLNINFHPELVDMGKGTEKLNLEISSKIYSNVDTDELIDLSARKTEVNIKDVIKRRYGDSIAGIKVNFWPFWVNSAPSNKNRIEVDLNF